MAQRTEMIPLSDESAHDGVLALLDSADSVQKPLPLSDLSAFRRDLLFTISSFEGTETAPSGVAVAEDLQAMYTESVTQGRFYQNLRELVASNLVEKRPIDGRTSAYYLCPSTAEALATHLTWGQHCLGAGEDLNREPGLDSNEPTETSSGLLGRWR